MRRHCFFALLICGLVPVASQVAADGYTTSVSPDAQSIAFAGGESQSAVVPAGKLTACINGRILITDDHKHPSNESNGITASDEVVHWRNLAGPGPVSGPTEGVSKFFGPKIEVAGQPPPGVVETTPRKKWKYSGADHQIVALPNGDVIYQYAAFSKEPLTPKPVWFDHTSRGTFGPGARSTLLTWRSHDCGATFTFVSEIDGLGSGYEDCANPQPKDGALTPPFDMGGTDGQGLAVDRDSGTLYAVFQCAGRLLGTGAGGGPVLTDTKVKKTYVFASTDGGNTFVNRGFYRPNFWGPSAVAMPGNRLAVGSSVIGKAGHGEAGLMIGKAASSTGAFVFPNQATTVAGAKWGWDQESGASYKLPAKTGLADRIKAIIASNTVLARVRIKADTLLLAFPSMIDKGATKTQGYRVFFYDAAAASSPFTEIAPVVPFGDADKSVIMHLTAIDPGDGGPTLLYWYDLDGASHTGRVRGRVIYDTSATGVTADFEIALKANLATPFALPLPPAGGPPYWFGDYKTAGGFLASITSVNTPAGVMKVHVFKYYPMWVQPDQAVHYNEVTVTRNVVTSGKAGKKVSQFDKVFDFVPLIRRVEAAPKSAQAAGSVTPAAERSIASALFVADPRLRNPALRVAARPAMQLRRAQHALAPPELPPALNELFREHEQQRGPRRID